MNILVVFGTRPEAIKMAPVVHELQRTDGLNVDVCVTAQHREMLDQVLSLFEIEPDFDLNVMKPGQDLTDVTSNIILAMRNVLAAKAYDRLLVHGDTTTTMAGALAAFYAQVPVGHVEAGLRTGNLYAPWPEEANRMIVGRLAALHFAPTETAVGHLHKSGVVGQLHQTGNTVIDALLTVADQRPECPIPGLDWDKHRVMLSTVHRRENWGAPLDDIATGFLTLLDRFPDTAQLQPHHRHPTVRVLPSISRSVMPMAAQ